jgi:hypothetical protein
MSFCSIKLSKGESGTEGAVGHIGHFNYTLLPILQGVNYAKRLFSSTLG